MRCLIATHFVAEGSRAAARSQGRPVGADWSSGVIMAQPSTVFRASPVSTWGRALACGALALVAGLAVSTPASAQGAVKGKYGDWEMRCETPPGASRGQCAIIQSVAAEDKPNINLVVIVLKTADGKSRLLRVIAPLGVLLPAGLGLKIDQTDVGRAGFVRCLPSGCIAEVVMEDKLIDQMGSGQSATFIIFNTPEEGVGIPLALGGFKDAYSKLP
jgi:invasion protein IalB